MPTATNEQKIAGLYTAFFNRAPDQEGLNYWTGEFGAGSNVRNVAAGFQGHPVFEDMYGAMDDEAFVSAIYQNVLGGAGDAEGQAYWVGQLNEGVSRSQMVADFVESALTVELQPMLDSGELTQAEYDAALTRQQTVTNKADVGVYFATTLGAQSNLAEGVDAGSAEVVNDPAYQSAQQALVGVTADEATVTAAQASIDEMVVEEPVEPAELAQALANLQTAEEAEASFLEGLELDTDLDGTVDVEAGDADAADVTTLFSATALNLDNNANTTLNQATYLDPTKTALQDADIQTAVSSATGAVTVATTAAEAGMTALLENVDARAEALVAALEAANEAGSDLADAQAVFTALTPVEAGYTLNVDSDSIDITDSATPAVTTAIATKSLSGTWSLNTNATQVAAVLAGLDTEATTLANVQGLSDLVSALQAQTGASGSVAAAEAALSDAVDEVILLENDAYSVESTTGVITTVDTAGSEAVTINFDESADVYMTEAAADAGGPATTLADAAPQAQDLLDAMNGLESLNQAIALYQEAREMNQTLVSLGADIVAAEEAIENEPDADEPGLGFNLLAMAATVNATTGDDVILFEDSTTTHVTIGQFGQGGVDQIYFGEQYSLVALGEQAITESVGSASAMEIFWQETATGLDLYVEAEAFAGSGSTAADLTMITLTGLTSEDITLGTNFLSAGSAA